MLWHQMLAKTENHNRSQNINELCHDQRVSLIFEHLNVIWVNINKNSVELMLEVVYI